MKVLSLFDWMSCWMVALERAWVKVDTYYSSEIDNHAIKVSEKNYPNIIRLGDVNKWRDWDLWEIDLIIWWSPCQWFSFAWKQLAFDDPRSKLFFTMVDIIEHYKPKYFLLENVKMKQEFQDIISSYMWVQPIEINSNLVSAQNRKRFYWTNIPWVSKPIDKWVMLVDILHEWKWELQWLTDYIVPFDKTLQILDIEVKKWKVWYFRQDSQANRIYTVHWKAVTLCWDAWWWAAKMWQYFFWCISPDRVHKRQNWQRFNDWNKFYTLTAQDKHWVLIDWYIRKLTPIECERLQTLPDNYTEWVSNTQRYKMLGNWWTVDVIAHIFSSLYKK